ncbi:nuclear transport factor 2 family protein [Variovorax sp. EL159]|uniref:nuclear transport factor 2 family protein n=1 Tax=Variovorax sp. EL159 TaxID=1566270 RepID=UPI000890BFF0|nr:nuclear transport factor 2 family protein [Variovorax sp. EL159]SCX72545.1 hypothetical protein SAMN03159363_4263 [Variovorax sp. EL159]
MYRTLRAFAALIPITLMMIAPAQADPSGGFDTSWTDLRGAALRSAVEKFYTDTFNDDVQIRRYFSKGYVQNVDGKTLRFDEFLTHVGFLRSATKSLRFEVIDAAYTPGLLADRHRVHIVKTSGESMEAEVLAFFRIENGRIAELNELTQVIKGAAADREMGSRVR